MKGYIAMNYYTREELELMTTYELRDICYEEKIVNGMLADFDKDEYIYQIMRFRGRKEHLLISEYDMKGNDRLSQVLKSAKLDFKRNTIRGCAKLICYENLSTEIFDNFTIGYEKELVNTNTILVNDGEICAIFNIREKNGDTDKLYITKSKDIPCVEANKRSYALYCMDRATSDLFYSLYYEDSGSKSLIQDALFTNSIVNSGVILNGEEHFNNVLKLTNRNQLIDVLNGDGTKNRNEDSDTVKHYKKIKKTKDDFIKYLEDGMSE